MHISTMRRSRPASTSLLAILVGFLLFAYPALALASAAPAAPSPGNDIICRTSDPKDCYPRIFEPTEEFQTVHDDQEIPPGLHVRLDITTGLKQAKINIPDEVDPSLEGLPVGRAIVVVDPEEPDAPQIPKGAPEYDPVGKVKEPVHGAAQEAGSFQHSLKLLKSGYSDTLAFDTALGALEDISHDIYYGLKITEDREAVKTLLCMMAEASNDEIHNGVTPRDQQAAAILAGALSNNPTALNEVAKHWPSTMLTKCPRRENLLGSAFYWSIVESEIAYPSKRLLPSQAKARVAAVNNLIKDDGIRARYLQDGGMKQILEVLIPEEKEWAAAQRKAGQLALDNFLDEDMGAKLGQWPTAAKLSAEVCRSEESKTEEGCWDYHVERIMKANKKDKAHWSRDLHDRLAIVRKDQATASLHAEL